MTFMFDNNFSPKMVKLLKGHTMDVIHLKEVLPEDITDVKWLAIAGEHSWVVITMDQAILRNPAEKIALIEAKVTAFFLHRDFLSQSPDDQLMWFIKRGGIIKALSEESPKGTIFKMTIDGESKIISL